MANTINLLEEWHETRSVELASKICDQLWEALHGERIKS